MGIRVGSSVVLSNGASIVIEEINNSYFVVSTTKTKSTRLRSIKLRVFYSHRLASLTNNQKTTNK